MQTVEVVREKLNHMASLMRFDPEFDAEMRNDPQKAFRAVGIYEESDNQKLYAWIPVPSLLCPTPANPHTSADCPTIIGCPPPQPKK